MLGHAGRVFPARGTKNSMTTRTIILALLLAMPFGCSGSEGEGETNSFDWSRFPLLVPLSSQVVVSVGQTYSFSSNNPEDGGEALGSCTISLNGDLLVSPALRISTEDVVLANFQAALPRQSDDFFSIQIQGDFVSWGLSDKSLTEEWSNRPGGRLQGVCTAAEGGYVSCDVFWEGQATENRTSEPRAAKVEMKCLFIAGPPCSLSCIDQNPCTLGGCIESECVQIPVGEGSTCRLGEMVGRCTAEAECVELPPEMQP